MKRRARREGWFMVAVMQKCKHFATFAENNDTAGRGSCACERVSVTCMCVLCVCVCVCGWVGAATALQGAEGERRR